MSLHLWTLALSRTTKSVFTDTERKSVKKVGYLVSGHILSCGESFISIVAVYHAENIESQTSFRWDIDISVHYWLPTTSGTCFQSFDPFGLEAFHPGID